MKPVGSIETRIEVVNSDSKSSTAVSWANIPGSYVDDVEVVRPASAVVVVDDSASVLAEDAYVIDKGISFLAIR